MSFSTAWSANAVSICQSTGLGKVERIEVSRRYRLAATQPLSAEEKAKFAALVGARGHRGRVAGQASGGLRTEQGRCMLLVSAWMGPVCMCTWCFLCNLRKACAKASRHLPVVRQQ
jgi:hypothetical protein